MDLICIATDEKARNRCAQVGVEYGYSFLGSLNVDAFSELPSEKQNATVVVVSTPSASDSSQAAGMVQIARQFAQNAFIISILDHKANQEATAFLKRSGANLVLLENEFLDTSKLEFAINQRIHGELIPVKASEFVSGSQVDFRLCHMLPLNRKLLPVLMPGMEVTPSKHQKMREVGELYLHKEDLPSYLQYLKNNQDLSAQGLASRCRAQYLHVASNFSDLALLIADRSESTSFAQGKKLYEKIQDSCKEMLISLASIGDAYQIIDNAAVGDNSSIARSPAVAAYAGLVSLSTGLGDSEEIMMAALLSDFGMLEFPPSLTSFLRNKGPHQLPEELFALYEKHPIASVNVALARKIPLSENIKKIILATHERRDKKGFPNRIEPEKIPMESQLIQLCEILDQRCLVRMGEVRRNPRSEIQKILQEETQKMSLFSLDFLNKVKSLSDSH